ncbi:MAG TPA: 6-phosphogluconolactonase [Polyangiaceae bacterium]|nr:6-phosphogluconolactonase [Polyangiaceae bacterium]
MSSRIERIRVASEKIPAMAAAFIAQALAQAVALRGTASFCLAGGTTPRATYVELTTHTDVPWPQVDIYFGDERCVGPEDPDSNYRMAREALLDRVAVRAEGVRRMRGEDPDREQAARDYERQLPRALDVVLLGIGEDGHTASLFPNSPALEERTRRVVPVIGPKPPPARLTLTAEPLQQAGLVLVLAAGAGKAEAVARALEGQDDVTRCPAQLVRNAVWIVDPAASAALTGSWR